MPDPRPVTAPHAAARLGRPWVRQVGFTLVLVGLVCVALGAEWRLALAALGICATSFGFFYLAFPGGLHFGITMANFLAVYACMFVFFHDANFPAAGLAPSVAALALPVAAFLLRCFLARRRVAAMIRARRSQELTHLPRLTRWLPTTALVGALSFVLPRFALPAQGQGAVLVIAMATIAAAVVHAQRDVILLMMDVAMVFEGVSRRIDRLVMPAMAFLTFYSLLVIVFACLYRIAELTLGGGQFVVHGRVAALSFSDALYFSVVTISTVGYGDITPVSPLARGLSGLEVVCGLMLLLFGFAEIMRGSGPESEHRRRLRPGSEHEGD